MPTFPQTEVELRNYLRTVPSLLALLANDTRKVDLTFSTEKERIRRMDDAKTYVVLFRVGGSLHRFVSTDFALFTFHCYGVSRKAALELANALSSALSDIEDQSSGDCVFEEAELQTLYWSPDPEDGHARYVLSATLRSSLEPAPVP